MATKAHLLEELQDVRSELDEALAGEEYWRELYWNSFSGLWARMWYHLTNLFVRGRP